MFKGENVANYIFHSRNPFRNKFQRWCIKHKLIHKLDFNYIRDDLTNKPVGALILYEGNKFLLAFLKFMTDYHFSRNYEYVKASNGKLM